MTAPAAKLRLSLSRRGAERKGREVTLMTGQIDLWPIALPQPGDDSFGNRMMVCERRLSNDERIRARRYEPRRRAEFVITRGTMREILRRYAEQQTSRLVFQVGPFGKPSLANSTIRFNLTHTAGLAMLAVSRHHEIGIDIERNRSIENALEIAERFFSANDVASLRRLPRQWRSEPFLLRWTAREALLKARGETLDELGRISQLQFNEGPEIREACVSLGQSKWWIRTIRPAFEIVGSIAVDAPGLRVVQRRLGEAL